MSSDVRVHVRLGPVRLDYEGAQAFYEAKVESLVEAAAVHGAKRPGPSVSQATPAAAVAPTNGAVTSERVPGTPPPVQATPAAAAYEPKSPEFGRYIRRLGPEAGEPDRQVIALAFYLWNYERRETFGKSELLGCFKALSLPVPADLDALLVELTERKRFLEPAGDGAWKLAKKGENYVKTRLLSL